MQPEIKEAVIRFFQSSPPGRILDFPAGTGWLSDCLPGTEWDYHPADLYCHLDSPNFKAANLEHHFPYADDTFDYVACLEGIEHVENYHHVLREAQRVLKPGGTLLISTPNPLNIKSRRRLYWSATYYGFPHLVEMPSPGSHIHVSPVNLSFLIAFARQQGLAFSELHKVRIRPGMYRYLPQAWVVQAYVWLRSLRKPPAHREWLRRLASNQVCLCDGMVVSFQKKPVSAGQMPARHDALHRIPEPVQARAAAPTPGGIPGSQRVARALERLRADSAAREERPNPRAA